MHKNIFLTGATGILGSHILFELLPDYVSGKNSGKILLLIRPSGKKTAYHRLTEILTSKVIPDRIKNIPFEDFLKHIIIIESSLNEFSKNSLPVEISQYTVIHAAASVNLGQDKKSFNEIMVNNYQGTVHLLTEMSEFASDFIFISTAYSSGHRNGKIENNFLGTNNYRHRNYYEIFKHKTEEYITKFCPEHNIEWKIIRPSIICGRLIDEPLYAISRFLVFYLFARYAIAMQHRLNKLSLRLSIPEHSKINIVPVDYVAKIIIASLPTKIQQINVVHPKNVLCRSLFVNGFRFINFDKYSFIEQIPKKATPVEILLQNTIGKQLGPYIETPDHYFDTEILKELAPEIELPEIENHFTGLIDYAAKQKFSTLY